MQAAAYLRVSDRSRQGDRFSLPAQRQAIQEYCVAQGWPEPAWYTDTYSAKDDDPEARPTFRQLLRDADARRFTVCVVMDVDRFARSAVAGLTAAARLERSGVRVVSLNQREMDITTPDGEMQFTLHLMVARYENRQKSRRVKAGLDRARLEGRHVTKVPFGARIGADGRLALDPETSPLLARILREAATAPDSQIAARLSDEGIPSPGLGKGGRWAQPSGAWWPETIHEMIRRGHWLAHFPEPWPSLWLAALRRPRRSHARHGTRRHMLTGLVRCLCGAKLGYQGGISKPLRLQCKNPKRPGLGYGCPYKRRFVAHYEALLVATLAALPPPNATRVASEPVDPHLWETFEVERQAIAWRHKHRLTTDAESLAELADLDERRAAVPQGDTQIIELAGELALLLPVFATLEPADQNDLLRRLVDEVLIDGDGIAITWLPLALALFPLPASGKNGGR